MASARITISGILSGNYSYNRPAFGYGEETVHIYKITSEDGKVYVWKTTSSLYMEVPYSGRPGFHNFEDRKGNPIDYVVPAKGDAVTVTAAVKGESEYKGEKQTELQRVKVTGIFPKEKEKPEVKKQELTLAEGDRVINMPYKQYKDHYSDCETVPGSFYRDEHNGCSYIDVVVRSGRMKASGVRGKHFAGYEIEWTENGKTAFTPYRAVSVENAIKRAQKDFPEGKDFHCRRIYF